MKITTKLWIGMAVLIGLSPLGIIVPGYFKAGSAWGEWRADTIQKLIGYIPKGLGKLSGFWKAPMPDYAFKGWEDKGLPRLSFAYIVSAAAGILLIVIIILIIGKIFVKKGD